MKDAKDFVTASIPGLKRPVGRPASGQALTPAERQKRRRERLAQSGRAFLNVEISAEVLRQFDEFLKFKDESKGDVIERLLKSQLLRKR